MEELPATTIFSSTPSTPPPPSLADLISALDHTTQSLKQYASSSPQTVAALRDTHRLIGSFLSHNDRPDATDEPMLDRAEEEVADSVRVSGTEVVEMEEGLRGLAIRRKRRKRQFPVSWIPEQIVDEGERAVDDPIGRRRDAIDLVFQFRG